MSLDAVGIGAWLLAHDFNVVDEAAINSRFGIGAERVANALEELKRIGVLAETDDPADHPIPPVPRPPKRDPLASVYVLECNGLIKIGITDNVEKRLGSIQTSNASAVRLVGSVQMTRSRAILVEQRVHALLDCQKLRVRGEWFRVTEVMAMDVVRQRARDVGVA